MTFRRAWCLPLLVVLGFAPLAGAEEAVDDARTMRTLIRRFAADEASLRRFYGEPLSELRLARLETFLDRWTAALGEMKEPTSLDAAIDRHLLVNHLGRRGDELRMQRRRNVETRRLLPFADDLLALDDARRRSEAVDPKAAAQKLRDVLTHVQDVRNAVSSGLHDDPPADHVKTTPVVALRAAKAAERLRRLLKAWFDFRAGYEPTFGWWVRKPHDALAKELEEYAAWLKATVAGVVDAETAPLIGDPIGRDALCRAITREMIPYTPEQLLVIAEREFAWCEQEGARAAKELGKADWPAAVEHVKGLHRKPGEQDDLVAEQAREAIRFLEERDLVGIPPLAAETWRLKMLSEKSQKTLPFAVYNDQHMLVAYATEGMAHDHKLQSMRGNNEHFTRIVTPHELIPGHHLQLFMAARHRAYRKLFRTPFFVEGWALHWEMLFYDLGWHRGPEDRIGMLFWRMHRCARILVTLRFHLGQMTPEEMVAFLRDRVGFEKEGARGEVRRYISGAYGPLYQVAYMIGGLQLRALHHELVGNGTWTNRAFHDAVLREGSIPLAMIRARLTGKPPKVGEAPRWRFHGDVEVPDAKPCPR
ncbi:MAG: DUF885 family protein [Planctomycetota bacterium]|nr:DUF885 family protein [Planctomycetota bacterium]